ncbi:leishmanolysin family protein, putative [Ichthyophthirius multifiliis]|uniref:Leishmanolysin family protein, putative n=1 Tax=Ichthyophthirius multifiliis TaxID=5932 RepID=G0QM11_ICHMU|nr:leishmanolysin family protein, putative [Ichthyophthirius multifiliis]EGR33747.1 leishmanolysin family protein, putative [Ichthyophthirius multifiliis]|eukprot:XP_004038971.1 leishmanolysin family protein, putative [Ichthyophthirius multifiliis]
MKKLYKQELITPDIESLNVRNLLQKKARDMIITYDMSYFQQLPQALKRFFDICEKTIQLAIDYFSRLIKIVPKSESFMKYKGPKCLYVDVPKIDQTNAKNSDLHLYISYKNDPNSEYLAFAYSCQFLKGIGPTHGLINFNLNQLSENFKENYDIQFEDLVEIVIHEMTHILGFSNLDMPNWVNSQGKPHTNPTITQKIKGIDTLLLQTPNVLKFAREYFGCPTLVGMPLQNIGGKDSEKSH